MLFGNCKHYDLIEGIIVNSFVELEPGAVKALKDGGWCKTPVYPVGPLVLTGSTSVDDHAECLKWLDGQPSGSVLFVSFGSGGTLSQEQLTELALGLEIRWFVHKVNCIYIYVCMYLIFL